MKYTKLLYDFYHSLPYATEVHLNLFYQVSSFENLPH